MMSFPLRTLVIAAIAGAVAGPAIAQTVPKPATAPKPPAGQAAAATVAAPAGEVVARIGGVDVRAGELRSLIGALGPREQAALAGDAALASQTVRLLLANQLVLNEALARKWDQRAEVAEQLRRVREAAIVELYLASVAGVPADFPSEADVRKVYDANKASLMTPRQFEVSQIFVAMPRDAGKATLETARKKVAAIQARLKQPGADFAEIATTDSDAKTAAGGGALGWVTENQLRPELRAILLGMAKDTIADPIQLDDGFHILKVSDIRPSEPLPFDSVREQLVKRLRDERGAQLRRAYIAELVKKSPPAINELELSKVLGEVLPKTVQP